MLNHQAGMPRRSANVRPAPSTAIAPATSQTVTERLGFEVEGTIVSGQYSAESERPTPVRPVAPGLEKTRRSRRCRRCMALLPVYYSRNYGFQTGVAGRLQRTE